MSFKGILGGIDVDVIREESLHDLREIKVKLN